MTPATASMALRLRRPCPSLTHVKIRVPRLALVAAMLALLAMVSMSAVAGWHSSTFHDDVELTDGMSHEHHHDGVPSHGEQNSGIDKLVHVAAHCLGQGVELPCQATVGVEQPREPATWSMELAAGLAKHEPRSLLRPPRG